MQLISGRDNGEQELVRFLKPYRRVTNPQLCAQNITLPQLTLWVYVNSRWVRKDGKNMKGDQTRSGSWCHLYLGSGYTPNQYAKVKRDLFASSRGLSGVYQDKANQMYAVVYKPTMQLSNAAIAALVGGTALAGIAGAKYARRSTPKEQASAEATPLTLNNAKDLLRDSPGHVKVNVDDNASANLVELTELGISYQDLVDLGHGPISGIQQLHIFKDFARDYELITRLIGPISREYADRYAAANKMDILEEAAHRGNLEAFESKRGDSQLRLLVEDIAKCQLGESCPAKNALHELALRFENRHDILSLLYQSVISRPKIMALFTEHEQMAIEQKKREVVDQAISSMNEYARRFDTMLSSDDAPDLDSLGLTDYLQNETAVDALGMPEDKSQVRDVKNNFAKLKMLVELEIPQSSAIDKMRQWTSNQELEPRPDDALRQLADIYTVGNPVTDAFKKKWTDSIDYERLSAMIANRTPNGKVVPRLVGASLRVLTLVRERLGNSLNEKERKTLSARIERLTNK